MKTQLKYQKILARITLIVAALVLIFSVCFFSGNLSDVMSYRLGQYGVYNEKTHRYPSIVGELVQGGEIYTATPYDYLATTDAWIQSAQSVLSALITMCIVFFVVIAFVYIFGLHSRRNYYITNYVMTGVFVVYAVALSIFGIVSMIVLMNQFMGLQLTFPDDIYFTIVKNHLKLLEVSKSPLMFILGIVAYFLVFVLALAWVYNLIWKIKLMKGEKQLLSQGFVKEVS